MYTDGFCQFGSMAEYWAFWSRYIYINRYMEPPKPVYSNFLELVKKDYFVITTNVDHCFQKAGFFTLREITVFSSAAGRAIKQHMIMKKQSAS